MTRHDETQLWDYAARSLEPDETKMLEHHLEECPGCHDKLEAVVMAREALLLARQSKPLIEWAAVDASIDSVIDRRLRTQTRRRWPLLGGLALVTLSALALGARFVISLDASAPQPSEPPVAQAVVSPPVPAVSRVERARGLQVSGARALDGAEIRAGDVLQTTSPEAARALVHLADRSHLRVANGTTVTVRRLNADVVDLQLAQGRIAVRASHQPRSEFVVHSGDLIVHVVGTVFSVSRAGPVTEVAVSEGRVRVETSGGDSVVVDSGQRVRFAGRNVQRAALTPALKRELTEVQGAADDESAALTTSPAMAPALGGALPRLDAREAKARQVVAQAVATPAPPPTPPHTQVFEPLTTVLVEAPPSPRAQAPEPVKPSTPESEWASLPATSAAPQGQVVPKQVTAAPKPIARDLESIFLQKAEAAIPKGTCEGYLLGLEEVASDAQTNERTEFARILRARCFDVGLRPRQAMVEYRKYLETYPAGRFVTEAREAMGQ